MQQLKGPTSKDFKEVTKRRFCVSCGRYTIHLMDEFMARDWICCECHIHQNPNLALPEFNDVIEKRRVWKLKQELGVN